MATVGAVENGNAVVLVTLGAEAGLLDRRQIELTEPGLPTHPYHHEGSWAVGRYVDSPWARPTTLPEAIAWVERVTASAADGARAHLAALAESVPEPIHAIAIRACPALPPTIEARIRDARAHTMADSVMYRQALAEAAAARGWSVSWYERESVRAAADRPDLDALLAALGRQCGPPWRATHKLAATAALAAARGR